MRKLFMVVVLLVVGALSVGCDDEEDCLAGSCVTESECLGECEVACDGEVNVVAFECTLDGFCLCDCLLGCFL